MNKKGDIVTIKNRTLGGQEIVEGKAELIKKLSSTPDGERWMVKFVSDGTMTTRWVPKGGES